MFLLFHDSFLIKNEMHLQTTKFTMQLDKVLVGRMKENRFGEKWIYLWCSIEKLLSSKSFVQIIGSTQFFIVECIGNFQLLFT